MTYRIITNNKIIDKIPLKQIPYYLNFNMERKSNQFIVLFENKTSCINYTDCDTESEAIYKFIKNYDNNKFNIKIIKIDE